MADISAKLEPILILARSQRGAAAAKIAADATAAPGVFVFSELLELQSIQDLQKDGTLNQSYQLLRLFAYGTLKDYRANEQTLPALSPGQLTKLKHLTLVSLALKHRAIAYDHLLAALELTSERELEDLIIDVIYAGLLGAKMHHHEKVLHVDWAAGRDVSPDEVPRLTRTLEDWCSNAASILNALDARIEHVRAESRAHSSALAAYKEFRSNEYLQILSGRDDPKRGGRGKGGNLGGGGKGGATGAEASSSAWASAGPSTRSGPWAGLSGSGNTLGSGFGSGTGTGAGAGASFSDQRQHDSARSHQRAEDTAPAFDIASALSRLGSKGGKASSASGSGSGAGPVVPPGQGAGDPMNGHAPLPDRPTTSTAEDATSSAAAPGGQSGQPTDPIDLTGAAETTGMEVDATTPDAAAGADASAGQASSVTSPGTGPGLAGETRRGSKRQRDQDGR